MRSDEPRHNGTILSEYSQNPAGLLPSALEEFSSLTRALRDSHPVVFLDYDGTLTPIVSRPEEALLAEQTRQAIRHLAAHCPVAIVSGRDLRNVRALVALDEVIYAGSHGFDIAGPAGMEMVYQKGVAYLPALDRAENMLRDSLAAIAGCQIERKKFAIAVHFRRVAEAQVPAVENQVDRILAESAGLRKTGGKMIFELRPDIDWDKGKALQWLLDRMSAGMKSRVPVYLGDDLTDEDALRQIRGWGIGIRVGEENVPTGASYRLKNPQEVGLFLDVLADHLAEKDSR